MIEDAIGELHELGYCVLRGQFAAAPVLACREMFWPFLVDYLGAHGGEPNRGPHRHYIPMPFEPPCFAPAFFFDPGVLAVVRDVMQDRIVADQWGCDVPVLGSEYQSLHVDYQRPLFPESPGLPLPAYMLVVSFGLVPIARENGPIEIAPGSHRLDRQDAIRPPNSTELALHAITLNIGDVLIRHPWTLHRGSPNRTETPRALVSIRYVRHWYADHSRDVSLLPRSLWESITPEQQRLMRFPIGG